jgi:glycosyltransferase involved in cell wall biosynthesis
MQVEQARNFAVTKALEEGCKFLLFIDDDMIVENTALIKLFETMIETEATVVAADYQKKAEYEITAHGKFFETNNDYIKTTDLCAMGFTLLNIDEISKQVPSPYF